jgi:hypothetical protein
MKFEGLQAALPAALLAAVLVGCNGGYQGLAAPNASATTQATLPGTAALTGIVDEFASGTPLAGFTVTVGTLPNAATCLLAQTATANPCGVVASTVATATTNATGAFTVSNLPYGTYMVTIGNGTSGYATLHRSVIIVAGTDSLGTVNVAQLSADEQALFVDVNHQRATVSVPGSFGNLTVDEYAEEQARAEVASIVAGTSTFGDATETAFGDNISAEPGDIYGWSSVSALSTARSDYLNVDQSAWFGEKTLCPGGNWQTCPFSDSTGHYINLSNTDDVWVGFAESSTSFNYQNAGTNYYAYAAFTPANQTGSAPNSVYRAAATVLAGRR